MIDIIDVHLDFIDKEIDKYYERFNFYPVLICSQDTRDTLISYCFSLVPMINLSNTSNTYSYKGCHILIDNTMKFGMIDIR